MKKRLVSLLAIAPVLLAASTTTASPIENFINRLNRCQGQGNLLQNTVSNIARSTGYNIGFDYSVADVIPGAKVRARWGKIIDRVAESEVYFRKDSYLGQIGFEFDILSTGLGENSFAALNIDTKVPVTLEYNRFSKNICELTQVKRKKLTELPFDTERAMAMQTSEYFKFEASNELGLSTEALNFFTAESVLGLGVEAGAKMVLSYQIHVIKTSPTSVKLRLLGLRLPELYFEGKIGVMSPIKFTDVKIIDKRLTKLANLELVNIGFTVTPKQASEKADLIEFNLDLTKPTVATAYNNLMIGFVNMAKITTLEKARILNPFRAFKQFQEISESISKDMQLLALTHADGIQKETEVDTESRKRTRRSAVGYIVGNWRTMKGITSTDLVDTDEDNGKEYFRVTNFRQTQEQKLLFNISRSRQEKSIDVVYNSTITKDDFTLDQIVLTVEAVDKRLGKGELQSFLTQMRRNVRPSFYSLAEERIIQDWFGGNETELNQRSLLSRMGFNRDVYKHANLYFQVIISGEALKHVKRFASPAEAKAHIIAFLRELKSSGVGVSNAHLSSDPSNLESPTEVNELSQKLYSMLDTSLTDIQRDEALKSLNNNSIFMKVGPGLLQSLLAHLSDDQIKALVGYQVVLRSPHLAEPIKIKWENALTAPDDIATRMIEIRAYTDRNGQDMEIFASSLMK
ncbi:MAG: hypothetical protein V4736_12400 [Bdellovibrionota bacterium]